jgi:AraC-like DNA-binding protein
MSDIAHSHSSFEIHIILEGSAQINIENQLFNVSRNDVLIIPQNLSHFTSFTSPDFQNCAFSFEFKNLDAPKTIRYEYKYFTEIFSSSAASIIKIDNYERSIINTIFENLNIFSVYSINKINLEIANLFLELGKKLNLAQNRKNEDTLVENLDQFSIRKYKTEYFFQKLLNKKIPTTIGIENLANELFISTRQTSRFLKNTFGLSFKQMLTHHKMLRASRLLKIKNLSIEEIAESVGYSSYNGFLSAYKKYYGKTPQQTRQEISDEK